MALGSHGAGVHHSMAKGFTHRERKVSFVQRMARLLPNGCWRLTRICSEPTLQTTPNVVSWLGLQAHETSAISRRIGIGGRIVDRRRRRRLRIPGTQII